MRIAKYVQKPTMVTPLYQQLLVLIPLLKVIEESRPLINNGGKPFRHEANHLPSGQLCIGLTEANSDDDSGDRPETTITIYSTTRNSAPLRYQDTLVFAWTYLCNITSMSDEEQKAMYERFFLAWGGFVFGHEQQLKEMALA